MTLIAIQSNNGMFCNAIKSLGGWLKLSKTSDIHDSILYTEEEYEQVKKLFPKHTICKAAKQANGRFSLVLF